MTDATWIGGAVGLLAVPSLYFFWMLLRKAVSFGFFLVLRGHRDGAGLPGALEHRATRSYGSALRGSGGFAFASVCSAIRARVARLVSILFIIAMVYVIGWRL